MAEPTLSRTGMVFTQNRMRMYRDLGVTDHAEEEYGPDNPALAKLNAALLHAANVKAAEARKHIKRGR